MRLSSGAAGGGERFGAPAQVRGALLARSGTDVPAAAVRAGGGTSAAEKDVVAAFGLTAVDHAVHLSLFKG